MPEYSVNVSATSNVTLNTEDTFIELSVNPLKIKYVRARIGNLTTLATGGLDNDWAIRLVRKTAGGATGTGGTAVRRKQSDRASGATVTVKNGTNAFSTATLGDIVDVSIKNGRETFEWVARDEIDYIEVHPTLGSGGMFAVLITSGVASQVFEVSCSWEE